MYIITSVVAFLAVGFLLLFLFVYAVPYRTNFDNPLLNYLYMQFFMIDKIFIVKRVSLVNLAFGYNVT